MLFILHIRYIHILRFSFPLRMLALLIFFLLHTLSFMHMHPLFLSLSHSVSLVIAPYIRRAYI